jgi:hypothetical protein
VSGGGGEGGGASLASIAGSACPSLSQRDKKRERQRAQVASWRPSKPNALPASGWLRYSRRRRASKWVQVSSSFVLFASGGEGERQREEGEGEGGERDVGGSTHEGVVRDH